MLQSRIWKGISGRFESDYRGFEPSISHLALLALVFGPISLFPTVLEAQVVSAGESADDEERVLEIHVKSETGSLPGGTRVEIRPQSSRGAFFAWRRAKPEHRSIERVDFDGISRFRDLPAGTYTFRVHVNEADWLDPSFNPLVPTPEIVITEGEDPMPVEVELVRGVRVTAAIDLPDDAYLEFAAVFRHPASGAMVRRPFREGGEPQWVKLPEGEWEVEIEGKDGYLLSNLLVDREEVHTATAYLLIDAMVSNREVVATFTAPCLVEGAIIALEGGRRVGRVQAKLLQAGAWESAARRRGIDLPRLVMAAVDPLTDTYSMRLPDGRWRIEPVGDRLLESRPGHAILDLRPGEEVEVDFAVRVGEGEDPQSLLNVSVRDEEHSAVDGAIVEAHAVGSEPSIGLSLGPKGRSKTIRGHANLNVGEGSYRVVAGHENSLEAWIDVEHAGRDSARELHRIQVTKGAEIAVVAKRPGGEPLVNIALEVERTEPLPEEIMITDGEFAQAKRERRLTTGYDGRAKAAGFYSGDYLLKARSVGAGGELSRIELSLDGSRWQRELEVSLPQEGTLEVQARELPGARLIATVGCGDSGMLPRSLHVRLLGAGATSAEDQGTDLLEMSLRGKNGDRLEIAPLDAGTYRLGIRPRGFDRFVWAYGALDSADADGIRIDEGDRDARRDVEVGRLEVPCLPSIDLYGEVAARGGASWQDFPRPRDVARRVFFWPGATVDLVQRTPGRRAGRGSGAARTIEGFEVAELEAAAGLDADGHPRFEIRGLPTGPGVLEIVLDHPHFRPSRELRWQIPIDLRFGAHREMVLELEGLGGALDYEGALPAAEQGIRLRLERLVESGARPEDLERAVADGGQAADPIWPSLPPGRYLLHVCAADAPEASAGGEGRAEDARCTRPLAEPRELRIRRGETTHLQPRE